MAVQEYMVSTGKGEYPMNHIYKLVWNRARNMYMAVSETAKSHGKSGSISRAGRKTAAILLAVLALTAGAGTVSLAADNTAGSGDGVAVGTGSSAPKAENVAIGKGATILYSGGASIASTATGDIVVGSGANINNYANQGGSIAIGKNAKVENMAGGGEASFAFGQTTFSGTKWSSTRIPADPSKVVGSIAIGDNTFARTGSTMIGSHNYKGELGDTTVDSTSTRTYALNVYATTIGANSFSNGAFTTNTGSYNIISSNYDGGRLANPVKNMGATITGALNSIESIKGAGYYSGIANTVSGIANRTSNSNGTLIYGAGNEVTNSITSLKGTPTDSGNSAKEFSEKLRNAIKESNSGGATLVIGGANVADYTQKTQIIGVNNKVTGTSDKISDYNMINGYGITVTGASHLYTIGTNNTITNAKNTILYGDNRKAEGVENSVIIGNVDKETPITTEKKDTVILGHNANATVDGGVALGYGSIADREAGKAGLDLSLVNENGKAGGFSKDSSPVWKSNAAAVSVGHIATDAEGKLDLENTITRQITGVAAGSEDYDAVNVAQLRQVVDKMNYYTVKEGDKVKITVPPSMKDLTNKDNDGAKGDYGMAAGYLTHTTGIASTVSGSFSGITTAAATTDEEKKGTKYQGIAALSYGTFNYNRNDHKDQQSAGAVNSLVGQSNLAENSNAAQIYGSANFIKNSYRHISMDEIEGILNDNNPETSTPDNVMAKLQETIADEKTGGMVTIVGSANTADTAYMTQIQGVSNTVKGTVTNEDTTKGKTTTHNYVGGFVNELQNGKNNYIIGTKNTIKGSDDSTTNASNIVIGDNHKLTNGSHNVIIGSEAVEEAGETPAARHGLRLMAAEETENSKSPDRVVRVGYNAQATVDDGVALGSGSVASTKAGVFGYDPLTGIASTSDDKKWKSTWAAASIGDGNHTRQLTNVAAGFNDTDAVNVAQLKAVASKVGSVMKLIAGDGISIVNKDGVYTISANIKGGSTLTDDVKVDPVKTGEGGNTSGATTDTPVTPVDPGNTGNPGNTENPSNGNGLIITAETKPTNFSTDSGEATAVKPGENLAIKGDATNITTTASDHGITVSLKKDITVDSVTAGDTKMTSDGLTITGGPSITKSGINADDKKITNVADGIISKDSKDAINGGQLYNETRVAKDGTFVKQANTAGENLSALDNQVTANTESIYHMNGRISDLDNRINKVGAGAAALAALHPLDFNPDDKWDFAVGYGNYRNANSVALGAFYRPNEDTMLSLGTNFGNGENMFNAGVSFKIGKGNSYAGYSKVEMAQVIDTQSREIAALKEENAKNAKDNAVMKAEIEALKKQVEALAARK